MPKETNILSKLILDITVLLAVGIPVLIFRLLGQPTKIGYFCDDDSIRYPFKESTISSNVLYTVGIFLPVTIFILNEVINERRQESKSQNPYIVLFGCHIPYIISNIYSKVGIFLFGACMSQLTTDIAKYSIGRLRPHFLYVCSSSVNCSLPGQDQHAYIEVYDCLGKDVNKIREARLSFPSGHSSFSAYTMMYTVLYLQANMKLKANKLLKPFLQFILLMMTWYTALSRIADFKHHWSEVLIGFLQGLLVAVIVAFFVSDFFIEDERKSCDSDTNIGGDNLSKDHNTLDANTNVGTQ